ncbi:uncharacterized protein LOC128954554 [Oppia nitens]|uniref:uncharacterized protein LOC128954554 n=1 Tax=Oppia nitens TaxID=1686743 RepID=UPI0023DA34C3|nr:uncharacterized protein LOC128954554 [Oppia nitens]
MTTTTTTRLMRDSFDRFGDDLANLLLAYLMITPEDKLKLQLVSKQWQSVLFGVQTDLTIDIDRRHYKQRVKLFAMILQKCPNITGVVITHRSDCSIDELVDLLMTYCPHLLHLRLHILHHECHLNWDTFDRLLSSFGPQLQTLELTTVFSINNKLLVRKVSDFVPQLKKLMIGYIDRSFKLAVTNWSVCQNTWPSIDNRRHWYQFSGRNKFTDIC